MNCIYCGAALTCSCQKKIASDGTQHCANCIVRYEQKLAADKAAKSQQQ